MKKVLNVLRKVLNTLICVPLCLVGAICLMPFILLALWIDLPCSVVQDIWNEGIKK